ncbi:MULTISPECIES: ABC transporter ATP-binding protein [unclassified Pseudoalteromonas]|uniref:ABC transporter ATP-binding protein n=1 Tax=unclassified Pseudoalteromonas TaxID=194690 RepID=UPI001109FB4E|nr:MULTISPECIES: ABC transporter ATP-binding protein [unclassified Pseudoalteromonas]TMN77007.1 ABC transporter ATP-binding protein [Pseudoalteromonas sp. S410]TMN87708.1 ABC transporter ATP-binding protein [Pseudoalteromonas sp. S408]TMN95529.1 ABC transporter ATP-binding protein [Pseudoalteromonas sp. S407]TMN96705.1 ABC transporter ATP-binding protein [Pseudoalteromonas sp. S409]TMO08964.1 ABC transporter ATP-binding protein [Pseudoalteromonas sp. S186]
MNPLITGRNLSKSYGSKLALNNVNFEIEQGAPVALVGPNGAGKTTLFSLLCGYIAPSSGELEILGHKPGSAALFNKVSALPQDAQLDPRFNIDKQLAFYAKLQGMSTKQSHTEALRVLDLVGLREIAKNRASDLSHGMRKRVTIAQALIGSPQIVMLDEATAGLDPIHAREVRELVSTLSSEATFILSSHDLTELERLCSQVLHLDTGVLSEHQTKVNQTDKHFYTLMLNEMYENVEQQLQLLNSVSSVYMSQHKEYVIEYNQSEHALDIALLQFCHQHNWQYRQLVNGHTLENQIFKQEKA